MSKLRLDTTLVEKARACAARVAQDTQRFIDRHTTAAVERSVCRLLGIDGVNSAEVPMPNIVVDHLAEKGVLADGAAMRVGNAMAETGLSPGQVAEAISSGKIDLAGIAIHPEHEIRAALDPIVSSTVARICANSDKRSEYLKRFGDKDGP